VASHPLGAVITLFRCVALLILCGLSSTPSFGKERPNAATDLSEVVHYFVSYLAGRALISDEGTQLSYDLGRNEGEGFSLRYRYKFRDGDLSEGMEYLWSDSNGVYVDQIVDEVVVRRYIASVEGPYKVLRIRPSEADGSFISRDCLSDQAVKKTTCYVKLRFGSDVVVSVYRESNPIKPLLLHHVPF